MCLHCCSADLFAAAVHSSLVGLHEAALATKVNHWLMRLLLARDVRHQLTAALKAAAAALRNLAPAAEHLLVSRLRTPQLSQTASTPCTSNQHGWQLIKHHILPQRRTLQNHNVLYLPSTNICTLLQDTLHVRQLSSLVDQLSAHRVTKHDHLESLGRGLFKHMLDERTDTQQLPAMLRFAVKEAAKHSSTGKTNGSAGSSSSASGSSGGSKGGARPQMSPGERSLVDYYLLAAIQQLAEQKCGSEQLVLYQIITVLEELKEAKCHERHRRQRQQQQQHLQRVSEAGDGADDFSISAVPAGETHGPEVSQTVIKIAQGIDGITRQNGGCQITALRDCCRAACCLSGRRPLLFDATYNMIYSVNVLAVCECHVASCAGISCSLHNRMYNTLHSWVQSTC